MFIYKFSFTFFWGKMDEKDVNLTYETLFELLMREKSRAELQQLDQNFFEDVVSYLNEKKRTLEEQSSKVDIFSSAEKEKTQKQLDNIKKILRDIYEKRENKIINMALSKSKVSDVLIDEAAFVKEEKKFFEQLVMLMDGYRKGIITRVLDGELPFLEEKKELNEEKPEADKSDLNKSDEKEQSSEQKEPGKENKIVRFKNAVPAFLGTELEEYGPFDIDEIANLPEQLANVLVEKDRAEFIEET